MINNISNSNSNKNGNNHNNIVINEVYSLAV